MKIIDAHHHLLDEKGYEDKLLRAMDANGIAQAALIGLGRDMPRLFLGKATSAPPADDGAVERAVRAHKDRFFGLAYIRAGVDGPDAAERAADRGFRGLKFHIPTAPYDSEEFFSIYERAQAHDLPCLFHTGIVCLPIPRPRENVRSSHMDVIRLEGVAQEFPDLKIIAAHMGVQSVTTALIMARIFPNIYCDTSGSVPGWRANYTYADWKRLLWWPEAHSKLLFGTDVHCDEIEATMRIQSEIYRAAGWDGDRLANALGANAAKLFGL